MRGKDRCKDLYSGMGRQRAEVPPKSRLGHQTGRRTQGRVTGSAVEATRQAGRGRRSRAVARAHLALVAVDLVAASHGGRRAPLGLGHRSTGLRLLLRQDLSPGRQSQRLHSRHGPRRPRLTGAIPRNRARREPRAPARAPLNGEGWRRLTRGRSDEISVGARGGRRGSECGVSAVELGFLLIL